MAGASPRKPDFEVHRRGPVVREEIRTLQINMGKLCNQACHHCHVDAGPKRTEIMPRKTAERTMELLAASPSVDTVDMTGGAPELNPNFRWLVMEARRLGRRVIDRCNLTVLYQPGLEGLPEFFARHGVEITASLPCYTEENVDKQRGAGVFEKSIQALQALNRFGYGLPGSPLLLNLIYNPLGPFLPPPQEKLESDYKKQLRGCFGIEFPPPTHAHQYADQTLRRFPSPDRQMGRISGPAGESLQPRNRSWPDVPIARQHLLGREIIRL